MDDSPESDHENHEDHEDDGGDAREIIADLVRITSPRGVQESHLARIGGIDQWICVRGQDRNNPIILFVHGGPASPLTPTLWQFQRPLEEYFTVVNYDQRGAGKTYRASDPESIAATIHIAQYLSDAIELAESIVAKYGARKLVLMGHSWGTVIGFHAALARPDLVHAYVGIGQIINTRTNEQLSFTYGLEQARQANNSEAVREMESIAPYPGETPVTRERIIIARKWPQYYGGLTAYRDNSDYYFYAPLLSPEYAAEDIDAIGEGNEFTLAKILPEFLDVDFTGVLEFPIPVLMFMGRHDYTTPSAPTAAWLEAVDAPYKRGVWFENSAHMIPFEEPGKTLISLVTHVRPLTDPPPSEVSAADPMTSATAPKGQ
ncbi:alpha/beta fold hydrolase [Kribbella sp. VKM Ac-2568]|uniref:alpha/beta fold hydrolase n=1 Tax=Kribbella sp. VKM Ac-2568 TaxID=2512219 RepID=UPI001050107B|nr:alpha/beta hydrolase [Kribbella sp. VKM Ac-2568]TCM43500.1 pimeloyl-ACP methyl ester carboxylesterase [Kribbella sp. VKM Ac-2568]